MDKEEGEIKEIDVIDIVRKISLPKEIKSIGFYY